MSSQQLTVLEMIAAGAPLESTLKAVVAALEARYPQAVAAIMLLEDDGTLRVGAAPRLPLGFVAGLDGVPIAADGTSCGTAVFRREPVFSPDIAEDDLWTRYRDVALTHGFRACWSVPISTSADRIVGTVALYFREPRRPTGTDDGFASDARLFAAIAIQRHQREEAIDAHTTMLRASINMIEAALDRIRLIVGDNWPVERERSRIADETRRVAELIDDLSEL